MALLWCDGFDHYGTSPNGGRDVMLSGVWAELSGIFSAVPRVSTSQARTGVHSLYFPEANTAFASRPQARRLLGANKSVAGIGFGLYMPDIFPANNRTGLAAAQRCQRHCADLRPAERCVYRGVPGHGQRHLHSYTGGQFVLWRPALYNIEVGDDYEARPGCDKVSATCKNKFDNLINFGGFDDVPGKDSILRTPNAK